MTNCGNGGPERTHWKAVVSDPHFLGEADFAPGEEKAATIRGVNQKETVDTAEGKSQKAVLYFQEKGIKPMILNVARSKAIEKVAGSPYFEDWPGVKIQLYVEHGIRAFGDIVNAVRVRPFKPRAQAAVPPCSECGGEIAAALGRTPDFLAAYTTKKFGVPLCADCAAKRPAQKEAGGNEASAEGDE